MSGVSSIENVVGTLAKGYEKAVLQVGGGGGGSASGSGGGTPTHVKRTSKYFVAAATATRLVIKDDIEVRDCGKLDISDRRLTYFFRKQS